MMPKLYIASSWRNEYYLGLLADLREKGYDCYDFRDPSGAFKWSAVDPDWQSWTPESYRKKLKSSPECFRGFSRDANALRDCDICVLLLPSGRSAHIEAGWAVGRGKKLIIYLKPEKFEPELMYKFADAIVTTEPELYNALKRLSS